MLFLPAFIRLEIFASVGIIILGSIGLAILTQKIFEQKKQNFTKLIFPSVIIILFLIPITLPEDNSWLTWSDFTPSILNGGSAFIGYANDDWKDATLWLKENTPEVLGYGSEPRVYFEYGVGGTDKLNSSSWILHNYFNRQRKLLGI